MCCTLILTWPVQPCRCVLDVASVDGGDDHKSYDMTTSVTLTDLVPTTSYLLAYALPLLLLSLILTFSGAFLTLDRSRSFVPSRQVSRLPTSYDASKPRHFRLYLEGGVGGILIGYCFGGTSVPLSAYSTISLLFF